MPRILNQKGMSLVEVMVAMAVMAIVSLGFAQMMVSQAKTVTYLEARMERTQLEAELRHEFEVAGHCESNFTATPHVIDGSPLDVVIQNVGGTPKINPSSPTLNKYGNITVTKAQLHNVDTTGPGSAGYVDLVVESQDVNQRVLRPATVRLYTNLGASGEIVSCALDTDDGDECLDVVAALDGDGSRAVPSDAKAIEIRLPADTKSWSVGTGAGMDTKTCTWGGGTLVIHLGKTKVGGKILEAGKTLNHTISSGRSRWFYDGTKIAEVEMNCDEFSTGDVDVEVSTINTMGPKCHSGSVAIPSNVTDGSATIWK